MQNKSKQIQKSLPVEELRLPSPPAVAIRILEAVKKQNSSVQELCHIVSSDPALALRILRTANSSMFSSRTKVSSIKQAITLMGMNALKNIALSFIIFDGMKKALQDRIDFTCLWKKSIVAAVGANILCQKFRVSAEEVFPATLLQDVGSLLLLFSYPTLYREILDEVKDPESAIKSLERENLGLDHQELGYEILSKWGLPAGICDLVRRHHLDLETTPNLPPKAAMVCLANRIASILCGADGHEQIQLLLQLFSDRFQIENKEAEALMDSVQKESVEILAFFEIDGSSMKSPSQILQEANEELGRLNLSYHQLVLELKRAKEKAESLAQQLAEANAHLRQLVYKDSLTGLYNHRYFQELMDMELSRATRYGKPLSLILFDLDHFKGINDEHGHPAGDQVLHSVAGLAESSVRQCDSVTRYGGEEFAVILPETDIRGALQVGERIRRCVEKMRLSNGEAVLSVTVSLGVTAWEPEKDPISKSDMISAADRALYQAKRSGRNRIRVG